MMRMTYDSGSALSNWRAETGMINDEWRDAYAVDIVIASRESK
jgi:hypothetical protein